MTASTFADTPTPAPAAARTGRRPAMATYARLDLRPQLRDRIRMVSTDLTSS